MRSQAWMHRQWFEGITSKVFFEVANLKSAVAAIGEDKFIHSEATWAVLRSAKKA